VVIVVWAGASTFACLFTGLLLLQLVWSSPEEFALSAISLAPEASPCLLNEGWTGVLVLECTMLGGELTDLIAPDLLELRSTFSVDLPNVVVDMPCVNLEDDKEPINDDPGTDVGDRESHVYHWWHSP
jgi:hypothetical protein